MANGRGHKWDFSPWTAIDSIMPADRKKLSVKAIIGVNDFTDKAMLCKCMALEFIGTMLLVFLGTAEGVAWVSTLDAVQISLTTGFFIAIIIISTLHISGGHVNPAITCSLMVTGYVSILKAACYVIAQCAGAVIGSAITKTIAPASRIGNLGQTTINPELSTEQGFLVEFVITFVLLFVIHSVVDENKKNMGSNGVIAIGLAVSGCQLMALRYSGASMNPARTFGPAVVGGYWQNHWVYWAGPVLGGVVAGIVYRLIFRARNENELL